MSDWRWHGSPRGPAASRACRRVLVSAAAATLAACAGAEGYDATTIGSIESSSGEDLRSGGAVQFNDPPLTYRIRYAIDSGSASSQQKLREKTVAIRRPFDASVTTTDGAEGDRVVTGAQHTELGVLRARGGDGVWRTIPAPPALAASDLRFDLALPPAVAAGTVVRLDRPIGSFAKRTCTWFRTGSSVLSGELATYTDDQPSFADVCIDADGLLLAEQFHHDGTLAQELRALSVETGGDLEQAFDEAGLPTTGAPSPSEASSTGPARVERLDDDHFPADAELYGFPDGPDGFDHVGRFASATGDTSTTSGERSPAQVVVTDVWVRGPDYVALDQGVLLDQGSASQAAPDGAIGTGQRVDMGDAGQGEAFVDLRGATVQRIRPDDGAVVRLRGTLAPEALARLAHTIQLRTAGELR